MSESEYLLKRLNIVESALRYFMMEIQQQMPPHSINMINEIGLAWDKQLDELEAERTPTAAHAATKQDKE